ncbi:UNVERIFIED_CONTAM: hypothetical protein IGO34_26150, partial [Salmonella enterica subsp. enterica serovar Weltevreden]
MSGANSYTWSTSANTTTISVSPTANTTYSVTGRLNSTGCTNKASYTQTVVSCNGIEDLRASEAVLSIYPNPGKGVFNIRSKADLQVRVMDQTGQV